MPSHEEQGKDRRVQKTEALLRAALGALMHERPYEEIVVKEILSRANVGRSTFYTHFADKDELLLSCIQDILRSAQVGGARRPTAKSQDDVLWFALPIFAHVESQRARRQAAGAPQARWSVHEHLHHALSELIGDEVRTSLRRGSRTSRRASPDLLVRWLVSTFVLVLNWWVESDSPLSAGDADALFRALVEPSLAELERTPG
jgi:AcrR family transcriptional regulator